MYYDKNNKKIDVLKWANLLENDDYKIIKQETVGKYFISTVWIGLDHSSITDEKLLIFETMVFEKNKNGEMKEIDIDRYTYLTEAINGHKKMVIKWNKN